MQDNELYTFFKSRSSSLDETPGDALWAKIESGLNNKPEPAKATKPTTLLYIIGSLLLLGGFAAYIFFKKTDEPVRINKSIELPAEVTPIVSAEEILPEKPVTDTVKRKKAIKALNVEPKQEIPFQRIESQNGIQERAEQLLDELLDTDYKTDKLPGRTIVTVKGKISTKLFQKLIEQTLEKNQTAYGDVIIVKAFGHKTFRKLIKIPESEVKLPTNGIIYKDSTYIHFMPSKLSKSILTPEILAKDSLEINYIRFKDTLSEIIPQKTELKNDKVINPQSIFRGVLVTDSLKIKQGEPVLNTVQPRNH